MSNERARLAREWAKSTLPRGDAKLRAAIYHILATTESTMADVEWDSGMHHLAGATTPAGHDTVMLWCDEEDTGNIITELGEWRPGQLAPNGKKYEIREIGARPTELSSEGDYRDAPLGTVVAEPVGYPWIKTTPDGWESGGLTRNCQGMFEIGPHCVLRMGDGS